MFSFLGWMDFILLETLVGRTFPPYFAVTLWDNSDFFGTPQIETSGLNSRDTYRRERWRGDQCGCPAQSRIFEG